MSFVETWLRVAAGFLLVAASATVFGVVALALLPWRVGRIRLCNVYGWTVGYPIVRLARLRPSVRNRERIRASFPAIYVGNHTSAMDLFLALWLWPFGTCGVMKKELVRVPFLGWLAWLSGYPRLDRADRASATATLDAAAALIRAHGLGVWMMPEGTRSRDGRLLPFKTGFVHLAVATGLPVVPVVLHGVHKAWEKGTLRFQPMELAVDVLAPIDTRGWTAEHARAHAADVHRIFAAALAADQQPLAPAPAVVGAESTA